MLLSTTIVVAVNDVVVVVVVAVVVIVVIFDVAEVLTCDDHLQGIQTVVEVGLIRQLHFVETILILFQLSAIQTIH